MKHIGINMGCFSILSLIFMLIKFTIMVFLNLQPYDVLCLIILYIIIFFICLYMTKDNLKQEEEILNG